MRKGGFETRPYEAREWKCWHGEASLAEEGLHTARRRAERWMATALPSIGAGHSMLCPYGSKLRQACG